MLKLHLGCGNVKLDGFVNIDMVKFPAVDKVMDARHLDYADSFVDFIYSAHVLEHFRQTETASVLKEWKRVLKPGGKMIVVIPDFNHFVLWYLLHFGKMTEYFIADVTGSNIRTDQEHIADYHKRLFNPWTFRRLSKEAGFSGIRRVNPSIIEKRKLHWSSMAFELIK